MVARGKVIGLTGGIGAGKSTVARMLADSGAVVIDADKVAHEVYLAGTEGFERIVARFGHGIVGNDGQIDRALLGARVFGDAAALNELNAIVHPLVQREVADRVQRLLRDRPDVTPVVEAALMTETRWTGGAGTLWVVIADPDVAMGRLMRDRGMTEAQARARIAAQATNDERRRYADVIVENNGSLDELNREVAHAWKDHASSP